MKKQLNVGMIGYNFMGKTHSNAWRQVGRFFDLPADVKLKTICGRNQAKTQAAAAQFGWEKTAADWRAVVDDPEIDIIDITTPNDSHAAIAIAAAGAGKAILCEKPLGMNVPECERMVAAVEKAGVVNMVCHNYRRIPAVALGQTHDRARRPRGPHLPLPRPLRAGVDHGPGVPAGVAFAGGHRRQRHARRHRRAHHRPRPLSGGRDLKEVCGLMETFIKERPVQGDAGEGLTAQAGQQMGKVTVDDAVSWIGRFENGALANMEATRFAGGRKNHITFEINGSKGSLVFNFEDMNRLGFYNNADPSDARGFRDIIVTEGEHPYVGAWWPAGHIIGYEHTFVHTFADFVKAVVDGKSVQPTFADGSGERTRAQRHRRQRSRPGSG